MTSKDLMIGDWYAFRGHPYKCTASDIASIAECEEKGAQTDISEIPITAEILEKNGFSGDCYNMGIVGFSVEPIPDEKDGYEVFIWKDVCLRYVHELQHALRLCEIEKEIIL